MSVVYVRFAVDHPSHYRVMFGGFVDARRAEPGPAGRVGRRVSGAPRCVDRTAAGGTGARGRTVAAPEGACEAEHAETIFNAELAEVAEFFFRNLGVFGALGV